MFTVTYDVKIRGQWQHNTLRFTSADAASGKARALQAQGINATAWNGSKQIE